MLFKAVAKNHKTGHNEWYEMIYTDGETVLIDAPKRKTIMPLKDPIQLWVQIDDNKDFILVWDRSKDNK